MSYQVLTRKSSVSLAAGRLSRGLQYIEVLDVYRLTADVQLENLNLRVAVEYLSRRQKLCQKPKASETQGSGEHQQHNRAGIHDRAHGNRRNARIGQIVSRRTPRNIRGVMDLIEQVGGRFA